MKITKIKSLLAVMLSILAFAACKQEPPTPPACGLNGQFVEQAGVNAFYGSYVIMLDNGTMLYPCSVDNNTINRDEIYNGMPITLDYQALISQEMACGESSIAPGGCIVYNKARITCISVIRDKCGTIEPGWCGTR